MNHKAKGTRGERELVKAFNEAEWSCIRVAGSGSSRYPAPDLLAGNGIRRIALECKVTKDKKKYFSAEELDQLQAFASSFGAESWVGVRFPDEPWWFIMLEDLLKTPKHFVAPLEIARRRGLSFDQLIGLNRNI